MTMVRLALFLVRVAVIVVTCGWGSLHYQAECEIVGQFGTQPFIDTVK